VAAPRDAALPAAAGVVRGRRTTARPGALGETALVRAAQGGSAEAMEELFRRHWAAAHRAAWLVVHDAAAAEDVAQEAFARAYRALGSFRGEASLPTWFFRILVNEAQRHRRWRWVRERFGGPMPEEPDDPRPAALGDPALRERVARALDRLPRGQREAFVLVHLEGLTLREAAETTGRATGTLKSHLHRALRSLREQLADLEPKRETTS
jgi:RNA polymerase sigma-70 factor (ECF subfamily)